MSISVMRVLAAKLICFEGNLINGHLSGQWNWSLVLIIDKQSMLTQPLGTRKAKQKKCAPTEPGQYCVSITQCCCFSPDQLSLSTTQPGLSIMEIDACR